MTDPIPSRPRFELRQVLAEGEPGPVEIFELSQLPAQAPTLQLNRRSLLALAGLSSTALFAAACNGLPFAQPTATPTPTLTPTSTSTPTPTPTVARTPTRTNTPTLTVTKTPAPVVEVCEGLNASGFGVAILTFSPNGKILVSSEFVPVNSTVQKHWLRFWSIPSGELIRKISYDKDASFITFSPDGTHLVANSSGENTTILNLKDANQPAVTLPVPKFSGPFAFSPDNRLMVVGLQTKAVQVWSIQPIPKVIYNIPNGESFAVSPKGEILAVSQSDRIRMYDLSTGKLLREVKFKDHVIAIQFSTDSGQLAVQSLDRSLSIVQAEDGGILQSFSVPNLDMFWLSPDGKTMLNRDDLTFQLWSVETGKPLQELKLRGLRHTPVASPDLAWMAEASGSSIYLWDPLGTQRKVNTCFYDPDANPKETKAISYRATDSDGITRTYALPCGSNIPAGAVCTCNCVPGTGLNLPTCACVNNTSGGGSICSCNRVCTCIPVRKHCFVMFTPEDRN